MSAPQLLKDWLPLLALLAGVLLGWAINATHQRRRRRDSTGGLPHKDSVELRTEDKLEDLHAAEVELAQMDVRLSYLNKSIASARQQIEDSEQEHNRLLVALDERQASVKDAQSSLQVIHQSLQTRTHEADQLLTGIDKSIEELDMLAQMKEGYTVRTNRLTQQVQWQDSELRMLRQTAQAKSAELDEARALLEQRDAELRLLIRQRQQREIDIEQARQAVARRTDELRRQVGGSAGEAFASEPPAPLLIPRRVDVTPPEPRSLPPVSIIPTRPTSEDEVEDDLTVIPRLADYYARQLKAKGVRTLRQLAGMTEDEVRALLSIPPHHIPNIEGWLKAARKLTRKKRGSSGA